MKLPVNCHINLTTLSKKMIKPTVYVMYIKDISAPQLPRFQGPWNDHESCGYQQYNSLKISKVKLSYPTDPWIYFFKIWNLR